MLIYMQISGWFFSGLIMIGYFYVAAKVNRYVKEHYGESVSMENEQADSA